ncbi:MAG: hypothetical protein U0R24_09345 [Solirubrobacterales bacterium]
MFSPLDLGAFASPRTRGYNCAVLRGSRPRQVLRCTVLEATS